MAIIEGRQLTGEEVRFYPILLTPTPSIRGGEALSTLSLSKRKKQMAYIAGEILNLADDIRYNKKTYEADDDTTRVWLRALRASPPPSPPGNVAEFDRARAHSEWMGIDQHASYTILRGMALHEKLAIELQTEQTSGVQSSHL